MQGIALLITPATPIYLNLWMCLLRDSGLVILLRQILIWFYSVAVLSQLYLAWIQDKRLHTHTRTHARTHTHFCPISWLFSILPVPYRLPDQSVLVLVPQMTCQTHLGSKLAASLSAATYSSSRSLKVPGKWAHPRLANWAPLKRDARFQSCPTIS